VVRQSSLHLHNIKSGARRSSSASSRLVNRQGESKPHLHRFSAHGFKRICQANDHGAMVTKRVLLRHRIARNSYEQQRFP
jgi:hypothetical protein